jgi:hypothetical protein
MLLNWIKIRCQLNFESIRNDDSKIFQPISHVLAPVKIGSQSHAVTHTFVLLSKGHNIVNPNLKKKKGKIHPAEEETLPLIDTSPLLYIK